ncbi:hypothetical protein PPH41_33980 [Burkholderia gladioli]|nr:hypothetical protein [Burkholderia gladioli]
MSVTTQGIETRTRRRALNTAIELISSMRFAIALLVVLAIDPAGKSVPVRFTCVDESFTSFTAWHSLMRAYLILRMHFGMPIVRGWQGRSRGKSFGTTDYMNRLFLWRDRFGAGARAGHNKICNGDEPS